MRWSKAHDELALSYGLPPAAQFLWRWLARRCQPAQDSFPDFDKFKEWVRRQRGRSYCDRTIKNALARLEQLDIIDIKRYRQGFGRLVLRPIEWLLNKPEKEFQNWKFTSNEKELENRTNDGISGDSADRKDKQQQLTKSLHEYDLQQVAEMLANAGIAYRTTEFLKIIKYGADKIKLALDLLQKRRERGQRIENPAGWLRQCLVYEWWLDEVDENFDFENYYSWILDLVKGRLHAQNV